MALTQDIAGYEGMYQVSSDGIVTSLPRDVRSNGKIIHRRGKVIKPQLRGKNGLLYHSVALSKDGVTVRISVHRLVAQAFIPNPNNLPEVNHKDKDTLNNCADNLEWCTRQYNIDYSKSKPVMQIDGDKVIATFKSIKEAGRATGIKRTGINNVLTGWAKTAGGYRWAYCI